MFPQGSQIFFGIARGLSDSSCIAAGMNTASSRIEAGTSGFLSISDINLGVSVQSEQGRQALSCVEAWNSACLSSCEWGVRPLVELYLEPVASSGECNQSVSAPSCCDLIPGVPFESVQGHQALSQVMQKSVSLVLWHEPRGFLWSLNMRTASS